MNRLRDRLDGHAVDAPTFLDADPAGGDMPFDQYTLERMAAQLADIVETLKPRERHSPPRTPGITRGCDDTILEHPKSDSLSGRQVEILCRVAEGMSNKEIAAQLHVSAQTIKNHMTHILDKLYANDRTHAVVLAYRLGLLNLEVATTP